MFREFQRRVTESGLQVLQVVHCHSCGWITSALSMMCCPNGHVMNECSMTPVELSISTSMWN